MNRRDLLKASLIIPAATAITTRFAPLASAGTCPAIHFVSFRITLTGPFGIVLHLDPNDATKCTGVTAFIPPDPNHQLIVNHNSMTLTGSSDAILHGDGLTTYTAVPNIDSIFNDFLEKTTSFVLAPYFLQITLPCPKSITTSLNTQSVQIPAGNATMPLNHVFEYEIKDASKDITITGNNGFNDTCPLSSGDLYVDVGLPRGSDTGGIHAACFFNNLIQVHFPHVTDKTIVVNCNNLKEVEKQMKKTRRALHKILKDDKGNDVECKNGGMLTLI
jgi:hypothetical protein